MQDQITGQGRAINTTLKVSPSSSEASGKEDPRTETFNAEGFNRRDHVDHELKISEVKTKANMKDSMATARFLEASGLMASGAIMQPGLINGSE
eukprot:CAMPEP_0170489266 /NCGR_PEP_ID=MMETSP0208-20121228/7641_1 /TAXON_ID=197538 /ORGANISM="Strombidium inclinatum, Strain S3" /LENGTH=93 /DNA_ID=CAMNT_0010764111 /DNA_START=139 /DNA_END=420 /DNA_ORIENTATION=-